MSRYKKEVDNKYVPIILVLIIIALIALGVWLNQNKDGGDSVINQAVEIPEEKIARRIEDEKLLTENIDKENISNSENNNEEKLLRHSRDKLKLFELNETDEGFKAAVSKVSRNLEDWFESKDVVRKYIVLINDISQNQILFKNRRFLSVPQKNMVQQDVHGVYLTKEGYQRYDRFANAVASIDVQKGLGLYLTFKPLFNKVYKGFSYPKAYNLDDMFLKAAANVINAPIIEDRIGLFKHSLLYKFSDKKLESLSNVEKQMLRMGPGNTRKIQAKLRQLVEAISVLNE